MKREITVSFNGDSGKSIDYIVETDGLFMYKDNALIMFLMNAMVHIG